MYKYKKKSLGNNEEGKRVTRDEHRYIIEQYLGRKLTRKEVVHHINGNKRDNDISNLIVMSLEEHSRLHSIGKKHTEESKKKISEANKNKISARRTKTKEDIIEIAQKYKEFKNYRKTDRYFGYANGTTLKIITGKQYNEYQDLIKSILKI